MGGMSAQDIYNNFQNAAGTSGLQQAQATGLNQAGSFPDRAASVQQLVDGTRAGWQGNASDLATQGLTPLAEHMLTTGQHANTSQDLVYRQIGSFQTAKNSVQPVPAAPGFWSTAGAMIGINSTSVHNQQAQHDAISQQNVDAYNTYVGASDYNAASQPTYSDPLPNTYAPVSVTVPPPPTPGTASGTGITAAPRAMGATSASGYAERTGASSGISGSPYSGTGSGVGSGGVYGGATTTAGTGALPGVGSAAGATPGSTAGAGGLGGQGSYTGNIGAALAGEAGAAGGSSRIASALAGEGGSGGSGSGGSGSGGSGSGSPGLKTGTGTGSGAGSAAEEQGARSGAASAAAASAEEGLASERAAASGVSTGAGASGMGGARGGTPKDDEEHQRKIDLTADPDVFENVDPVAPQVIGETSAQHEARTKGE